MFLAKNITKPSCKIFSAVILGALLFSNIALFSPLGFLYSLSAFAAEKNKASQKWTCPMHPHYIADEFGSCPICGMDLVKIQTATEEIKKSEERQNKSVIRIPAETIQKIGVRIEQAEPAKFGKRIRSFGIVKENERLKTELSARVEGWIEDLNITAVGDKVKKGEVLFKMFSPELIVSQRDFIAALGQSKTAKSNITKRLLSFGAQQQALNLITKKREVQQKFPFFATQNGTVAVLNVSPGSYVKRGMTIAKIQDYSVVWVIVNVSEKDMSFISAGTKATIYFPNLPGKTLKTKVDYIYPEVDEKTRTGRVRLVIQNKDRLLRPGTYADVVFDTIISERLSVPSEAVLKDESGDYVVISLGNGRFQSKQVKLGLVTAGRAEIKSGLKAGDQIVVSSQFLLDSESALRESFRKMERLQLPLNQLQLSKIDLAKFDHMVDAALYIHEAITDGYDIDSKFLEPAIAIKNIMWADYKETKLSPILINAERAFKLAYQAKTETEVKQALQSIILALEPWLLEGDPQHYKTKGLQFYRTKTGGKKWLQLGGKPSNPYNAESHELINWPDRVVLFETEATVKSSEKSQAKDSRDQSMRGSHGH